jgi:hypothetical protein
MSGFTPSFACSDLTATPGAEIETETGRETGAGAVELVESPGLEELGDWVRDWINLLMNALAVRASGANMSRASRSSITMLNCLPLRAESDEDSIVCVLCAFVCVFSEEHVGLGACVFDRLSGVCVCACVCEGKGIPVDCHSVSFDHALSPC